MKIAFLGTGLMGAGFVRRLCANGDEVQVWNRSPARAKALAQYGARAFDDAAQAVLGVDRIHLSLADDASVDAVLESIAGALAPGTSIVDHTTTAPTPTRERVARWDARGPIFVHVPVFMAPVNAVEGTGVMLVSGEQRRCDALLPALRAMTAKVVYLGAQPDRAAAFKLFGNLTSLGMAGVVGDVLRLAQACGIDAADAIGLYSSFNPGQTLPARAAKIASGPYDPPSFEVAMARKDVRLMIDEARLHGVELAVMPAVAALYDAAIARGEGQLDATLAVRPKRPQQSS
ncbi:MAG: NAD(P)-dependent oxidoreductase [Burkholderiaceae bacterium]|nr:NAD(P)-dependent oxidoreductase [Burkholderiaceae bacterium]